jgi:hypothetical protein
MLAQIEWFSKSNRCKSWFTILGERAPAGQLLQQEWLSSAIGLAQLLTSTGLAAGRSGWPPRRHKQGSHMRWDFGLTRGYGLLAVAALFMTTVSALANAQDWPDIREAKAIAEEGYVYGLPIVMNYSVMYGYAVDRNSGQFKAPFNEIKNESRVFTYKDTAIISPNSDTPYSVAWLDLRTEPVILSVPSVESDRYYSVRLIDGSTYNYGYIGSRATGDDAGDYMIVGPEWKGEAPTGVKKVFQSSTQFSLAIYRTQLFGPDDMPNVEKVQAGYKVRTLSAYLGEPTPAAALAIDIPKVDNDLVKSNFFEYLDFALQFAPAPRLTELGTFWFEMAVFEFAAL